MAHTSTAALGMALLVPWWWCSVVVVVVAVVVVVVVVGHSGDFSNERHLVT